MSEAHSTRASGSRRAARCQFDHGVLNALSVISLVPAESQTDERRTKLAQGVEVETSITPLTRQYTEQSQRGSKPSRR